MSNYQKLAALGFGGLSMIAGAVSGFKSGVYYVEPGYRAFKFSKLTGVKENVVREGWHIKMPFIEHAIRYDIRARPRVMKCNTGTADLQMVHVALRLMYKPEESQIFTIYRNLGQDWDGRVLPSIVNEVLRSVIAKYTAQQLAHQRELVSHQIRERLQARLLDFHIILDDTSITELHFGQDYQRAIEEKQIAEQQAQRAKFVVEKAQQEKLAKIVWAEGEAQAIKDVGMKLGTSTAYLDLMRVKIAIDVAKVLSRSKCRVFLQADTLLLNLQQPLEHPKPGLMNGAAKDTAAAATAGN